MDKDQWEWDVQLDSEVDMILSEYVLQLMAIAINNNGILTAESAYGIYNSPEAARATLVQLRNWGYIKLTDTPGVFKLKKAPDEAFIIAENLRGDD